MFTNRFTKIVVFLLVLTATFATASFVTRSARVAAANLGSSDFHQRHPDWTWIIRDAGVPISGTGDSAYPDYYQRHPELSVQAETSADLTDYFFRHPELHASAKSMDLTDYYFRHPEPGNH